MEKCQVCGGRVEVLVYGFRVCKECKMKITSLYDGNADMIDYFMDMTNYPKASRETADNLLVKALTSAQLCIKKAQISDMEEREKILLNEEDMKHVMEKKERLQKAWEGVTSVLPSADAKQNYQEIIDAYSIKKLKYNMGKCQVCGKEAADKIIDIQVCQDCKSKIQNLLDKQVDMINYFMDVTNYPDADEAVSNKLFNLSVELANEHSEQSANEKKRQEQNLVLSKEERIRAERKMEEFLEAQRNANDKFATERDKRKYDNLLRERGYLYQSEKQRNTIPKRKESQGYPLIGGIIGLIGGFLFFPPVLIILLSNFNMYGLKFGQWEIAPYSFWLLPAILGLIILPVGILLCDLREMVVCLEDIRSIEIDREWRELNEKKKDSI